MTFPTSRALLLLSTVTIGALTATGCDDSTDGTGGSATTSSSTTTNGSSMTTSSTSTSSASGTGSSSSTGGGGGVTPAEWDAYCDTHDALNCMGFDLATCKAQQACATAFLKDDVEKDLLTCFNQSCNNDNCIAVAAGKPVTAQGMTFKTACDAWVTECTPQSDDPCSYQILLEDDDLALLEQCLKSSSCAMKQTCIDEYGAQLNMCDQWN